MKMDDKKKVEAVLFAIGDKIEEAEIAKLTKINPELIPKILAELREEYKHQDKPYMIVNEATKWKLTLREEYMPLAQKIVPHTELGRAIMGTLAVVAWKAPVLQSDIIQIRGTVAYEHISELVELGFITKQKHGRSYMLNLSQQFYEYFDLQGKDAVREKFKDFKEVTEADLVLEELEQRGIEPYEEKLGKLEIVDEPIKKEEPTPEMDEDHLGKLEVFEEPKEEKKPEVEVYEQPAAKRAETPESQDLESENLEPEDTEGSKKSEPLEKDQVAQ